MKYNLKGLHQCNNIMNNYKIRGQKVLECVFHVSIGIAYQGSEVHSDDYMRRGVWEPASLVRKLFFAYEHSLFDPIAS